MGNYNIRTDMRAGDSGQIAWAKDVGNAVNDLDSRVTPSGFTQNVAGVFTLEVKPDGLYELTGTADATVTLSGSAGCQIGVKWFGVSGTLQGYTMSAGSTVVAVRWPSGWEITPIGTSPGDTTAPTPGTVAGSAITSSGFTLTIAGASDAGGLHAQPYAFSTDNGVTWSAYQASASLAITGKSASTGYQCKGRVRDAAGNTADTAAVTVTTTSAQSWQTVALDTFTGADGTLMSAHTSDTGGMTYTAGSNVTIVSNKMDIYAWNNQQTVTGSVKVAATIHRASFDYAVPATTAAATIADMSLSIYVGSSGYSASKGAGQFAPRFVIFPASANATALTLAATSTWDGALTLTPQGGHDLTQLPMSGSLMVSCDGTTVTISVNGTVWATAVAVSGCSFGTSMFFTATPKNSFGSPHWTVDNLLLEKYV